MVARFLRTFDNPAALLAIVVAVLISIGTVMVYSASGARAGHESLRISISQAGGSLPEEDFRPHHDSSYFVKQIAWTLAGLLAAGLIICLPMDFWEKHALHILVFAMFLLVLVVASPLGVESKGAKRWLWVGGLTIQPSEFAKLALVVYMARYLAIKRDSVKDFLSGFLPAVGVMGLFSILILLEKDLGTTVLMGVVVLGMWLLARVRTWHLAGMVLAAVPFLLVLIFQHSYRQNRILAFLDPEKYASTHAYQLNQSLIAIGSGGVWGTGLGLSAQKDHFLSEAHTDFIFAIVCEELGLLGGLSICVLFLAFVWLGFRISYSAPDYFSGLFAAGLTLIIGCAAFMNFFVVLGLAPTKGLALPFFTYGGSSMIATLMACAVLVSISNHSLAVRGSREVF